jgi:hypothetical protein
MLSIKLNPLHLIPVDSNTPLINKNTKLGYTLGTNLKYELGTAQK